MRAALALVSAVVVVLLFGADDLTVPTENEYGDRLVTA